MYTESDLREMLRISADRVPDDTSTPAGETPDDSLVAISPLRTRSRRHRMIAPVAVAAACAAAIAIVVALTQGSDKHHSAPAAGPRTSSALPAKQTTATPPPRAHLTVPVIDEVQVNTSNTTDNYVGKVDGGHGQQVITSQLGHGREMNVVIAPQAAFDDRHVTKDHPVAIAGTTGHYAVLELFPLSKNGKGGSAPTGTIVFHTPDGHWAFAWLQKGTKNGTAQGTPVDDPAAIVSGFDTLHARFAKGTDRTPLRVGYLPADAVFDDADLEATHGQFMVGGLTTVTGTKQMDISLLALKYQKGYGGPAQDDTTCIKHVGCTVSRHRAVPGGFELTVNGTNYSAAETQKVLDSITVATNPNDPSTYFPLVEAVG